ncbi:hypothetical protein F5880DRAFT_1619424 [Lentinula raphanica]|nr:hypothetical protein F5880DRAFT_1619424 [Lentinula raphanica]
MKHFIAGECFGGERESLPNVTPSTSSQTACEVVVDDCFGTCEPKPLHKTLLILDKLCSILPVKPLQSVLDLIGLVYSPDDTLEVLRRTLQLHIKSLQNATDQDMYWDIQSQLKDVATNWPQLVPPSMKARLINDFKDQTSSRALATFTCASCAESCLLNKQIAVDIADVDLSPLLRPDVRVKKSDGHVVDSSWLSDGSDITNDICCPLPSHPNVLLDQSGIVDDGGRTRLLLCCDCHRALKNGDVPHLALANHIGDDFPVPFKVLDNPAERRPIVYSI